MLISKLLIYLNVFLEIKSKPNIMMYIKAIVASLFVASFIVVTSGESLLRIFYQSFFSILDQIHEVTLPFAEFLA